MARPGTTSLKVLAVTPGLLASTVLTCLVGAVLPPLAGLAVFVGGLALLALFCGGRLEDIAVRVLGRARRASPGEVAALTPAVILLSRQGLDLSGVRLYVRGERHGVAAAPAGRRSVLVSNALVRDLQQGRLPSQEAAAVVAHAVGALRLGLTRSDLAIAYWTLPWQLVTAMYHAVARALAELPLVRFAWRIRFVIAGVAVVQSILAGRLAAGAVVGAFIVVTYLAPTWQRAWGRRVLDEGDQFVLDHDLGHHLAAYLQRSPASQVSLQRIHRLAGSPASVPVAVTPRATATASPCGPPAGARPNFLCRRGEAATGPSSSRQAADASRQ